MGFKKVTIKLANKKGDLQNTLTKYYSKYQTWDFTRAAAMNFIQNHFRELEGSTLLIEAGNKGYIFIGDNGK